MHPVRIVPTVQPVASQALKHELSSNGVSYPVLATDAGAARRAKDDAENNAAMRAALRPEIAQLQLAVTDLPLASVLSNFYAEWLDPTRTTYFVPVADKSAAAQLVSKGFLGEVWDGSGVSIIGYRPKATLPPVSAARGTDGMYGGALLPTVKR